MCRKAHYQIRKEDHFPEEDHFVAIAANIRSLPLKVGSGFTKSKQVAPHKLV